MAAWKLFANGETAQWDTTKTNFQDLTARIANTGNGFGGAVDQAIQDALSAVQNNSSFAGSWQVVTGDTSWVNTVHSGVPVQEFLTHVPEPSEILLLVLMVALVFGIQLRRTLRTQ